MKKATLRILALAMALLMVMALAACGNSDATTSDPATSDAQTESSNPQGTTANSDSNVTISSKTKRDPVAQKKSWEDIKKEIPADASGKTLIVYDWNPQTEVPGMEKVNKNFTKETGIKLNYTIVTYGSYFTKITAEVAAKNAPDAVRLQNISRQNLVNLQPINKLGYDFSDPAWDKNVLNAYTFNGNIYGVNMVDSPLYCPVLVYYNTNLIKSYDLDDPYELWKNGEWTWDKLWDMCKEFKKEADGDGFLGISTMAFYEYQLAYNKPTITYDKATNTYKHNLQDSNYIRSWQIYANNYDKGYVAQALTDNDNFNSGKLLFNVSMGIASRNGSSYFKDLRAEGVVACVPLPALKEGSKDYQLMGEVQAFGVPKGAKNAALVPYYLRYYFDVNNYNMNGFYNVKYADEVIKYIQKSNPSFRYETAIMTTESTGFSSAEFFDQLKTGGAANVKMTLDSFVPKVEQAMKDMQGFLSTL